MISELLKRKPGPSEARSTVSRDVPRQRISGFPSGGFPSCGFPNSSGSL